jgi:predicted deacylase
MRDRSKNRTVVIVATFVLMIFGIGVFVFVGQSKKEVLPLPVSQAPIVVIPAGPKHEVIGKSVEGRDIEAFVYGTGTSAKLLFVGGIHGGYEWNSVLLAYQLMDYLKANPESIPKGFSIAIVPSANPDGIFAVTDKDGRFTAADIPSKTTLGQGRFNAHKVDLNRNFDCKWQPKSTWKNNIVSAGSAVFSEPEAQAIRDFVSTFKPTAAIFFHSQSNAVYASECENGILPETRNIMNAYAKASKYPAVDSFSAYEVTGDAEGWLASIDIPAITVELSTHQTVEWDRNLLGIKALFNYYEQKTKTP